MFRTLLLTSMVFLTANCTQKKPETSNKIFRKSASLEIPVEAKSSPAYCTAIRGNGELAPSHWSAMSRIVENLGMPKAMSGGSSATITMFYLESIAANPLIEAETNPVMKKRKQALLLKTIPIYKKLLAEYENVNNAYKKLIELKASTSKIAGGLKATYLAAKNREEIEEAIRKYGYLFNTQPLQNLRSNFDFAKSEMLNAVSVFGSFNAKTDDNLFFRPGLVDFKYFALLIGQIGDFYAGNVNENVSKEMDLFLDECSLQAYGELWPGENDTDCKNLFAKLALQNITEKHSSEKVTQFTNQSRIFQKIGSKITAFPTTSVLVGDAYKAYLKKAAKYSLGKPDKYKDFALDFKDIKFGYWGPSKAYLENMSQKLNTLFPNDLKSKNFYSLGSANWFEVLSSSPAEPGLANFQKIMTKTNSAAVTAELAQGPLKRWKNLKYKKDIISAGGWSDLSPTLVLRAHGCENIVYLTRTDGETVFGQQVFIRLAGLKEKVPFWGDIEKNNKTGWDVKGTDAEATPWHKLYNVKNENSSFNTSTKEADAVYCTNWNAFSLFKGQLNELWNDAYNSPMIVKEGAPEALAISNIPYKEPLPGCL